MGNWLCPLLSCGMCYCGKGGCRSLCSNDYGHNSEMQFANLRFSAIDWYDRGFRFRVYVRCTVKDPMCIFDRNTLQHSYKISGGQYYNFIVHDFDNNILVLFEKGTPAFVLDLKDDVSHIHKYTTNQEGSNAFTVSDDMMDALDYSPFGSCA
jgi:hypothetical protein